MKYIERVGGIETIYEGEPKEIAELQSLINPRILTIKNEPLNDSLEHAKEIANELMKEIKENNKSLVNPTININYYNPKESHAIRLSQSKPYK